MMYEASELSKNIKKLSKFIVKHEDRGTMDPTLLALMKAQHEHMCAYFNTLLLRCEMTFTNGELNSLYNILDKDGKNNTKDTTND